MESIVEPQALSSEEEVAFLMGQAMHPEMNRRVLEYLVGTQNKPADYETLHGNVGSLKIKLSTALHQLADKYGILDCRHQEILQDGRPMVGPLVLWIKDGYVADVKKYLARL